MRLAIVDSELCVGCQSCMFACTRVHGEAGLAGSCIGIRSAGGMRNGFRVIVCRACPDPPCARVCPADALEVREGKGGVKLKKDRCIGCGNCVEACPYGAIFWNDEQQKPFLCFYCGYCASFCPHGVLAMERKGVEHAP